MHIDELFSSISNNQRKIIQALLDHPEGLFSNELAELTAVSNKSATMSPDLRDLLEQHGLELIIERVGGCSRWVIRQRDSEITLSKNNVIKAHEALDQIMKACHEIKQLLCQKEHRLRVFIIYLSLKAAIDARKASIPYRASPRNGFIGLWCNGNTTAFDAVVLGSSPGSPATYKYIFIHLYIYINIQV